MTTKKWKDQDQVKLDKAADDLTVLEDQKGEVETELTNEIIAAGIMPSGYSQPELFAVTTMFINHTTKIKNILKGLE